MGEQFVGAGWAFPMRTGPSGGFALVTGQREIEEAMRLVLATAPGERPMRPEFGCAIHDLVFAPVNDRTIGRIQYEVRTCLDRWEPRIKVESVEVSVDPENTAVLFIDVRYSVRGTNNPRALVFPFYVIPSNESGESGDSGEPGDDALGLPADNGGERTPR